ncbi:uncharacterized protein [Mytilus edulis]
MLLLNMEKDGDKNSSPRKHIHNARYQLCRSDCKHIMDAWTETNMESPKACFNRLRKVVDLKRTSSDSAVQDLNKASHVPIPYGKAPYRSRKANKILQKNQSTRPVPRGTWIPGVNDEDIVKPTHFMPSEAPPSTMRQHQRRVLSASSCPKSLCSSFNSRFMLPGYTSTSDSSSEEPITVKDDTEIHIRNPKPSNIRKSKSMYVGTCKLIQVSECKETRFSTLPRRIPVNPNNSAKELNRVPVFDPEELDSSINNSMDPGLPGMCDVTPRPLSKGQKSCTCCSLCEIMSPRLIDFNPNSKIQNCSCETCLFNSKGRTGLVQYKHGDVIKTFNWLERNGKETEL